MTLLTREGTLCEDSRHVSAYNCFRIQRYKQILVSVSLLSNSSGVPRNFVRRGGGSTNSLEDREDGDLGAVAP